MLVKCPTCLLPLEIHTQPTNKKNKKQKTTKTKGAPKLRVAIVGGGLAGLSTAVELLDQGYEVDIYEGRQWVGGKVASFKDKDGNHIEMGLHVFFGCYFNLFRLMDKVCLLIIIGTDGGCVCGGAR